MTVSGGHRADAAALARVTLPALGAGLMLGRNRRQEPFVVRAFGPRPTMIALLGGVWMARVMTLRAMAVGARLVVHPNVAPVFNGFAEGASARRDRTVILEPERLSELPGVPHRPIWYVGDSAERPTEPWQTTLSMLPQLTVSGVRLVMDADLVVARTLTKPAAALTATALRLPASQADYLQMISGDMIAVFGTGSYPYLRLGPTTIEQQLFGAARPD